jgi:voltage-gated potassium channel
LDIRKKTGANIIGMKLDSGKYIFNPDPQTKITANSKLFVLGTPNQIRKFKELLKEEK